MKTKMKKNIKKPKNKIKNKKNLVKPRQGHFTKLNAFTKIAKNKVNKKERYDFIKSNKILSKFLNILSLLLFITSYYFYYLSLEKFF